MPLFQDDEYGDLSPVQQLLRSPEAGAASQGLQNISRARMNQPMGVSPIQAYQQSVVAQATANQRRKINDLTIQGKEQDLDAFYDYKQFQRDFPDQAKGVSYQDFKTNYSGRIGASMRGFAPKMGTVDGKPVMVTAQFDPTTGQYTTGTMAMPEGFQESGRYLLVSFLPRKDYARLDPVEESLAVAREILKGVRKATPKIDAGITGRAALSADEMQTTSRDMTLGAILGVLGVAGIFVLFFRRLIRPLLAVISLVLAIAWTFGLATITL